MSFRAKKSMGQNFLMDRSVVNRIIETVDCKPQDRVLEIGPGQGALTAQLAAGSADVLAVELDRQLIPLLEGKFSATPNVAFIHADILKLDLRSLLAGRWPGKWKVVANLPYNISSQVLFKLLDCRENISRMVLMLQKEVGDRLAASPASKEYGILSVLVGLHFDIRREFIVRPGSFHPVPKVDSVVLSFTALENPRAEVGNEPLYRRIVKAAFAQRRKTLWNCLRSDNILSGQLELRGVLDSCGIDGGRRGETLTIDEFACLSRAINALQLLDQELCGS